MSEYYEELRTKHGLPAFKDMDIVFEISNLDDDHFYLRNIRRNIIEKLKAYIEILEDLIHPNSTVSAYHECKFFDDEQKRKIYDLYARLMSLSRRSSLLELDQQDKLDAEFISEAYQTWPALKSSLENIMRKLESCWSEEEISDTSVSSYFG